MKIKFKILGGFFVIIAMLMVAGAMSIYEFTHLSNAINSLVEDNYKSIEASKNMIESLEREDSGTLLF
ncbi:MAG: histidine kinase, partial [Bacteroidetes bacterium HGW-Bacteroidetes-21]